VYTPRPTLVHLATELSAGSRIEIGRDADDTDATRA